jgi:predicted Zn-dependent peptidase
VKELATGKTPVTKDELEREKQGAILGLPGQFATGQAALGQYRRLVYFGLPLDYYDTFAAKVGQVTEAQVKASATKHLSSPQAVWLVVGDGDAKVIVHQEKADVPYEKAGKQLTLREALADLAARGDVGPGGLVELDADGHPKPH